MLKLIGLCLIVGTATSIRAVAEGAPRATPDPGQCKYKTLPPSERPSGTLPYAICESSKSCREAKADWIEAFDQNEKAKLAFKVAVQAALDAELKRATVRDALVWSSRTPQDLETEKSNIGTLTEAPAAKLATALRTYREKPDTAGAEKAFKDVAGVLAADLSAEKYLVEEEKRLQALRDHLAAHRKDVEASLLTALQSVVSAVRTPQIADLDKRAKDAANCLDLVKTAATFAGVDTAAVGQPQLPAPGVSERISIQKALFGELDKDLTCDALPKLRDTCEFEGRLFNKDDGKPIADDTKDKPAQETRRIPVKGPKPNCSFTAVKLCDGGDGPGQLGKQKLRVTWTCGDDRRFCKTWAGGETAYIICDPKGMRSDYIESPKNRCD